MGKPIGDARGGVEAGIGTLRQYAELGPMHRGRSAGRRRERDRPDGARAARRGGRDHPVERPGGGRLRAARRGPGRPATPSCTSRASGRPPPAARLAAAPRRALPGGRAAPCSPATARPAPRWPPARRSTWSPTSAPPRPAARSPPRCAAHRGEGAAGERRQRPADRRRRRGPGVGGGTGRARRVRQRRPDLLVGRADLRAPRRRRTRSSTPAAPPRPDTAGPATGSGRWSTGGMRETVHGQVRAAVADGARVLTGGELPDGPGRRSIRRRCSPTARTTWR